MKLISNLLITHYGMLTLACQLQEGAGGLCGAVYGTVEVPCREQPDV
jgi:hypothetical protein